MDKMKKNEKPLISICVPVLNEEDNVAPLLECLETICHNLGRDFRFEIVFSDNKSSDNTWDLIKSYRIKGVEIRGIRFTRNVGFQNSIWANYSICRGDAIIQIDADLQDPPELIYDFLRYWTEGYQVVYGIRENRKEGWFWNLYRKSGYFILNRLASFELPQGAGDFRLIDRTVANHLLSQTHLEPFLRGAIAKLGYREKGLRFERKSRRFGYSKFNARSVFNLGMSGILSYSTIPLRIASLVGIAVIVLTFLGSVYYIWAKLSDAPVPLGFTTTQVFLLFGLGMNAFFLGIIGEYIARIFRVVMKEPQFIIADQF
jgi:dolichol-phosphate mannosyltransferase